MANNSLHKISEEDLIFTNELCKDRINVTSEFSDYDWMQYQIDTGFNVKGIGKISVKFKYLGSSRSNMFVQTKNENYQYDFDSKIFAKYMKRYFNEFSDSLDSPYAFYAGNIVIDWYNEVLETGNEVAYNPALVSDYKW